MSWYNIKVFSQDGVTQKSVKNKSIIKISTISSKVNGGYSDIKIQIHAKLDNQEYSIWDNIHIYKNGELFYFGYLFYIDRFATNSNQYIELSLFWPWGLISNEKMNKNYTDTASNIMKDIIMLCNTHFWFNLLSYNPNTIPNTTWIINIQIWEKNFLEYIQEVQKVSWINFFINRIGKVFFVNEIPENLHSLTMENSISYIKIWETNTGVVKTDNIGNSIQIKVNNKYNYEDIKPLDLIKVKNLSYTINNLIVVKMTYWEKEGIIELWSFDSFSDLIQKIWQ